MRRLVTVILMLAWCAAASARQYATGFEPPTFAGAAAGVVLTGQGGWTNPVAGTPNFNVYTYAGNQFTFPVNPGGGQQQFAAGRGTGPVSTQAEHAVNFGAGPLWTITWDTAVKFNGGIIAANPIGGLSLEPGINSRSFANVASWVNPNVPVSWNSTFIVFNAAGVQVPSPGLLPAPAWQNLQANRWYRQSVTFSVTQNRIIAVTITDLVTQATTSVNPVGWFLRGGSTPALPLPTAVRFSAGSNIAGNILAVDNFNADTQCFSVSGVTPPQAQQGQSVFIAGCGFGNRTQDLSVSLLQPSGIGIPLTVIAVTDTLITARMGAVRSPSGPGAIEVIRHNGNRGVFQPTIDDIIQEDPLGTHVWDRAGDPRRAQSVQEVLPLVTPPTPGTQWFFGQRAGGQMQVTVVTPTATGLKPNTTLHVVSRLHNNAQLIGSDLDSTRIRLRVGAPPTLAAQYLAERVCDVIKQGFESRGIHTSFTIANVGTFQRTITITLLDSAMAPVPVDFGVLDVATIDPILINPFPIGPVTAFFNAGLQNVAGTAVVAPIDMSGNDGCTVSPNTPTGVGVRLQTEPVPLNLLNSSLTVRSWGTDAGQPNQFLGTCSVRHTNPSFFDVFADFSDIGAAQVRVDGYYNTALKASVVVAPGTVAQLSPAPNFPTIIGGGGRPSQGPQTPFLWIDFDVPCILTPQGGAPVLVNQLRVFAAGPGTRNVQNIQAFDLAAALDTPLDPGSVVVLSAVEGGICYANCDGSTTPPALNVQDFACFLNLFASNDLTANCDGSTTEPVLNVQDFGCFLNAFAAGCS